MDKIKELRKDIFITGYKGGMAHLASCYSCLEILYTLYLEGILRFDPENPKWEDRDRFILSKGHAGLALFYVLQRAGLISRETVETYLQENSLIGGEPCMRDCEWIEATTGSLGHGLSMGLGMAIALKTDEKNSKVYVVIGDGECEEGTIWEAAMIASAFKLDNLVVILDNNKLQKMERVEETIGNPEWRKKWESFCWQTVEVDGHDIKALKKTLEINNEFEKPRIVIANTLKGKGVSVMEDNPTWHFKLPGKRELKVFKEELEINDNELE